MNIYQKIILVLGGIALVYFIYTTLESTRVNPEELPVYIKIEKTAEGIETTREIDREFVLLKYTCLTGIIRCAIVAALTFSAYVGFQTKKYYTSETLGVVRKE